MMIYVVTCGEYSDWWIKGYFETREEAEKYCLKDTDSHIEGVELLSLTENQKKITYLKHHEVVFDKKDNKWIMRVEPDRYKVYEGKRQATNYRIWLDTSIFYVEVTAETREKAEKIAQDCLYKYLAEEANL